MKSFLLLVSLVSLVSSAIACRCGEELSVTEAIAEAPTAFVGRAMRLTIAYRPFEGRENSYREVVECEFSVSAMLKGDLNAKTILILTSSSGTACGFPFKIGDEYLVYARSGKKELETDVCTRTRPRYIVDEKQDWSAPSKIKGDDALETEVPLIREALKKGPTKR